jgi:hypothetical protein
MRSTVRIASLLALWLWAVPALAQDETAPTLTPETDEATELAERLLPEYRPCTENRIRYACYTQEQQLQLNVLEENARTWRNQLLLTEQLRLDQAALVVNLAAQLVGSGEIVTAIRSRNVALTEQLMTEIEEKNRYRAEADSTDWWPLLVGGVVGLLGAGVAIGVAIMAATGAFDSVTSTSP